MKIEAEETKFEKPHIPEGLHHAEFVAINNAPDGQYGPRVVLDFMVYYSRHENPVRIGRFLGKKLTPRSILWSAVVELGGKPEVGKEFDIDQLLGNPCRVMVEDYTDNERKAVSGITKIKAPDANTLVFIQEHQSHKQSKKDDREPIKAEETEAVD